jgi:hypothetical protein
VSLLTTTTTAAYEYRTGSELPLYALKRRKAQKQCGFRAKSTYGHCIKDYVLLDTLRSRKNIQVTISRIKLDIFPRTDKSTKCRGLVSKDE